MFFNSIEFALFLPIVFLLYWSLNSFNIKYQNLVIVVTSYIFYGWWDWRFLFLILFSTVVDFIVAGLLYKTSDASKRKSLLYISVIVNIGLLGVFKYFNFFVDNFREAFSLFGTQIKPDLLNIVLPVGISFYTFQTLSYSIDVYRQKLKPSSNFVAFAAFVSFFPQLVAGPIERASNLLPQFLSKRNFDYRKAVDGMRQILWGLFKKMVIADNCAELTNQIFGSYQSQSGSVLILGAVFFAFQIYGDFSGYSDIAIGTARLFGIDLRRNFNYPYFSRDIAEFWRRWHISLTTWFRDYVYIPLGGSRVSKAKIIRNTLIIFLVSGLWHGANWTYIIWGLYHALLFLPLIILNKNRNKLDTIAQDRTFPNLAELFQVTITFVLICFGWIIFRSENIQQAFAYIDLIFYFKPGYFNLTTIMNGTGSLSNFTILFALISIFVLIVVEWFQRNKEHGLSFTKNKFSWLIYIVLSLSIYLMKGGSSAFIYFQF